MKVAKETFEGFDVIFDFCVMETEEKMFEAGIFKLLTNRIVEWLLIIK